MIQKVNEVNVDAAIEELKKEMGSGSGFSIRGRKGRRISDTVLGDAKALKEDAKSDVTINSNKEIGETVFFKFNRYVEYCILREEDMLNDCEEVEGVDTPTMKVLNFDRPVIGSDETGVSEAFKPIVVVGTYVKNRKELKKWIHLGISDSKDFELKKDDGTKNFAERSKKIRIIGKALTGFSKWSEVETLLKLLEGKVLKNDFFAIRVITNEEFNQECIKESIKNQTEIISSNKVKDRMVKEAHIAVLSELKKGKPGETVVIDDFTFVDKKEEQQETKSKFKTDIEKALENIPVYFTIKGDAKIMAVALASIISTYICYLVIDEAEEKYKRLGLTGYPLRSNLTDEFLKSIESLDKEKMIEMSSFVQKYVKIYNETKEKRNVEYINAILRKNDLHEYTLQEVCVKDELPFI